MRESKKLIYKITAGLPESETLQSRVATALKKYKTPNERLESVGADASLVRFINVARTHQRLLIGIFHRLTRGAGQHVIDMAGSPETWEVGLVTAKLADKPHREFIEGTLFFAIWKNHVVMHQSSAARAEQFQDYLSWLLSRQEGNSNDGTASAILLNLGDPIPPDLRKKSQSPVKRMRFGSSVETETVRPQSQQTNRAQKASFHFAPRGATWEGLKEILADLNADVPDLFLDNALGEDDIRVNVELSCTKKKAAASAGEVLTQLGRALSHSDADSFEIELSDGSRIRPSEMKVAKSVSVECVEKQPVAESIFSSMVAWYQELVDNGVIVEQEPFGNTK